MERNNNNLLILAGVGLVGYHLLNQHPTVDGIAGLSSQRKALYNKFLYSLGLERQDRAYQQSVARWNRMSVQQVIMEAYRYDILLVNDNNEIRMDLAKRYARATGQEWPQQKLKADFARKTLQQLYAITKNAESEYFMDKDDPS